MNSFNLTLSGKLRPYPVLYNWHTEKKYGPNERTDQSSQKIQLSDEEIANLSDAKLKTLVIRMLTEMVEYKCKIEEEVKAMQKEIKENVQGTNSDGKQTGTQIDSVDQKEERNIQPQQNEETRIKKTMSRGLGTSGTTLNVPTSES